jgi:hypothetical protein
VATHRTGSRLLPAALAALVLGPGCSLDVSRTRVNVPLKQEEFKRLEPGRTTRGEALDALGAPDKIEAYPEKDYLWWLHRDDTRVGFRFSSPFSVFGYKHTFAEVDVNDEDSSAMRLVFDRDGVLRDKSPRLAAAYREPEVGPAPPRWPLFIIPRYGYAPLTWGDSGERSFKSLYPDGQLFGGYLGAMPVPYFALLLGGNFQEYPGQSFDARGQRITVEDLHLYQVEAGGRFSLPPKFFVSFWDIDELKKLFYSDDVQRHQGALLYFQWTLGGTFNEEVGARIGGVPSGSYFRKGAGLSTALGIGFEYYWRRLGVFGGVDYQAIDSFRGGSSPLDHGDGGLQALVATGGISLRF